MPDGEPKEEKLCSLCKGVLDPNTSICTVCGIKDEGEEGTAEIKTEDDALTRWLSGDMDSISKWIDKETKKKDDSATTGTQTQAQLQSPTEQGESVQDIDILKKWFTGNEDSAIEKWLESKETEVTVPTEIMTPTPVTQSMPQPQSGEVLTPEKLSEIQAKDEEIDRLRVELDDTKHQMDEFLGKFKTENLDTMKIVDENIKLSKELHSETKKRERLEIEYDELRKGSISVIKYLKERQGTGIPAGAVITGTEVASPELQQQLKAKDDQILTLRKQITEGGSLPSDAQEIMNREMALSEKEHELQSKIDELKIRESTLLEHERMGIVAAGGDSADVIKRMQTELVEKDRELQSIQKSMQIRDDEVRTLRNDTKTKDDELEQVRGKLKFKEDELSRREEDLKYREEKLSKEARKIQEAGKKIGTLSQQEMEKRLEELQREISMKEAEVRAREKYLSSKTRELEMKARGLIEQELETTKDERATELKEDKVKTGTPRLDDLLYGGIPFSSNVLIYGPPFIGKEIMLNTFAVEGLKKGVPIIWVLTNKTIKTIREEMQFILPNYMDYEKVGLVKYVDIYSRTIGETSMDPGVIYIDQPTDTGAINDAVDSLAKELQKKWHEYYRLLFQTISTIMVRLDPATTFKFLSPFCGKRKRDKGVCLYTIEQGMHSDSDISMIGSMMEGEIDYKTEHEKSFMQVKGICDVQSRDWIEYTWSKRGINIKSFSLKLIK